MLLIYDEVFDDKTISIGKCQTYESLMDTHTLKMSR